MRTGISNGTLMEDTRSTLLVRLADRGDQEAWHTFDQLYRPMIVGYACTRGLDNADAEDVAQLCIESVVKHIADYRHQHIGSFKAWLRSIAANKIRDLYRRRRDQQADSAIWNQHHDPKPTPDEVWERHWLMEHLRYCVEKVRPDIADHTYWAFYHTVIENLPAKETAARLGIPVNQVYVAKFRVLERIRASLRDLTGFDVVGRMK